MDQDERTKMLQRYGALDTEFSYWRSQYETISRYLLPTHGKFLVTDRNKGEYKYGKILDQTGTRGLKILSAGMMSGVTSPARPWFRIALRDTDLMAFEPVKLWLASVTNLMREVFSRSNTYRVLPSIYTEMGAFGTACNVIEDNFDNIVHNHQLTMGQYRIGVNDLGYVDTLYRRYSMTVSAVVTKFGYKNCSSWVQSAYDRKLWDTWVEVMHVIEPRGLRDTRSPLSKNKKYKSTYFEPASNEGKALRESGFDDFPAICPRWDVVGDDIMGISPAMECLGDIIQLQHEQTRKGQGIDYQTKPPMQSTGNAKGQEYNLLPGGVTTYDENTGPNQGLRPAFQPSIDLNYLLEDIRDVRMRINQSFFADLFLMLAGDQRSNITAREIAERHEEKLQMLGPVLERLHDEMLSPMIDITFAKIMRAGVLPPPPPELEGMELKIEFVSILAQAQKAVGLGSIDRLLGTVGGVAGIRPEVVDKLDVDTMVDKYADMLGVDPDLIVANQDVAIIRQQRAQQQAVMQQAEAARETAATAKTMSETDTSNPDSALSQVLGNLQGYR